MRLGVQEGGEASHEGWFAKGAREEAVPGREHGLEGPGHPALPTLLRPVHALACLPRKFFASFRFCFRVHLYAKLAN